MNTLVTFQSDSPNLMITGGELTRYGPKPGVGENQLKLVLLNFIHPQTLKLSWSINPQRKFYGLKH
jgi:hypothetical protein